MVIGVSGHEGYWGFECQDLVCIMVRETAPVFFFLCTYQELLEFLGKRDRREWFTLVSVAGGVVIMLGTWW